MSRNEWMLLVVLVVGTSLSRLPFRASIPYGLDSIQYVLAVEHFDVHLHQPQPPGYFLFVMFARLCDRLIREPNQSFILMNVIFSGLAVGTVFLLGREIFDTLGGACSALLMATSPLVWHHGEVALSNMADCFFVCLLAWLCWRSSQAPGQPAPVLSAVVLGLAGGIRQNTLVFLFPLWVFSVLSNARRTEICNTEGTLENERIGAGSLKPAAGISGIVLQWDRVPRLRILRKVLLALACLGLAVAAWFLPMAHLAGGVGAYRSVLRDHWLNSNWHGFTLEWLPLNFITVGYFVLLGTGLGALALFIGLLLYSEKRRHEGRFWQDHRFQFFFLWMFPSLLFFVLIYSHPLQTGHSLIYLPALFLLLPQALNLLVGKWMRSCVLLLAVSYLGCFLFLNTAVSWPRLKKYESDTTEMIRNIRAQCPPAKTVLVNMDFMFLGFRDFVYHLPEYRSFQPRLYAMAGERLMFAGHQRKTLLIREIKIPAGVKHFVLNADELRKNPDLAPGFIFDQYPKDRFLTTTSGVAFLLGETQELPRLFPHIPIVLQ